QKCPIAPPQNDRSRRISHIGGPELPRTVFGGAEHGIEIIHGISHASVTTPSTIKNGRHPKRAIKVPPSRTPIAGPKAVPVMVAAFASPRRSLGKSRARIVPKQGHGVDSPMPSSTRMSSSMVKPCTSPVSEVASDQRAKPPARIHPG